ncbi:MAG TPA: signal peptidase II [Dehalococcoidales bacterium]|nr:signal peptidase II [Dehalococcoidales bacterium]
MRKVNHLQDKWRNVVFSLTGLLIVVADQLSKVWIRTNLVEGQSLFEVGFFRITYVQNTGAAFGLLQGQSFALTIVAIIGIVVLLVYALFVYRYFSWLDNMLTKFGLGLMLGGTLGNLIDRLRFGYVTDFIDFGYWPAFNVADSAITVGVIIFACSLLRLTQAEKH